jgi:hypothetical protein
LIYKRRKNKKDKTLIMNITVENNKLIAEFMGLEYESLIAMQKSELYDLGHRNTDTIKKFYRLYHNSWDWLMPVVEKIINLKEVYAQERQRVFSCISPDISKTYTTVVEFIKWYNQNGGIKE